MNHQKATTEETPLDTANSSQLFDFQNQGTQPEESPDTQSAAVSQDINRSMAIHSLTSRLLFLSQNFHGRLVKN